MNKLYTAQEIADKLQIKKTTVYELIKRGELYSSKVGKQLRISEQQLKQYLERSGSGNNMPDQKAVSSSTPNGNLQIPELPPESSLLKRDYLLHSSGLILCGQFSPALDIFGIIAVIFIIGTIVNIHENAKYYDQIGRASCRERV